ncbi:MAG: ABC transporter permease [Akkermansia sp.]|nr:ABC transporter permease [Akkermansia sp.]MBR3695223.1 ABC transporter permease [Akkermansia sp.]
MREYIIRRLLLMPITLIGISFVVFCLTRMVPGGPVERMLQEQAISSLAGEKAIGVAATTQVSDADIERLEELFNLQEPVWLSYLQWLGIRRREVEIAKAEFMPGADTTQVVVTSLSGHSAVIDVKREGKHAVYAPDPWFEEEGWRVRIESPRDRALRWAKRNDITDEAQIAAREKHPTCSRWRAVAYRKAYDGLLQGQLGRSYKYNESVAGMIGERLPVSLYFGLLGVVVSYLISIPLGVSKALHHKSLYDGVTSAFIFMGYAIPGFALGAVLLVYLGARLEWFPLYGLTSPEFPGMSLPAQLKDIALHTVLPLSCYVVSAFAMTTMMMKNSLMEHLSADYMRTAIAKGVSFRRAVWGHAFRNSFIPLASTLGGVLGGVVGGSILIERVFDIQGFGMLSFQALMDKDYSLIMGTVLLGAVLIVIGNLLSDIFVAMIDPRIKFE